MREAKRILALALFLAMVCDLYAADWYDSLWRYRQKITILASRVSGSGTLTNFPLLVTHASVDLNLFEQAQGNGNDILFTKDDHTTKLSHEIEQYDTNTDHVAIWVKIPELSGSVDMDIYMYYANLSAGNQENATNVWISSYRGDI